MKVVLLFYLKYIGRKRSQIWDTLPISKMELFVTITVANVVFYWKMVLHTQLPPMNFLLFVSVDSQGPSRCR